MSLSRFAALAASYGGDIGRWPEAFRDDGRRLAAASPEAGRLLDQAARLDAVLLDAGRREAETLLSAGAADAALARLRRNIAAHIAATQPKRLRRPARLTDWLPVPPRLAGLATVGSVAVMAGLLVGALTVSQPDGDALLALMQPVPLALFTE